MPRAGEPPGYTLIDLVVVLFLVSAFFLVMLVAMPRGREQARLTGCQKNLSQIGLAVALYNDRQGTLPGMARAGVLDGPDAASCPGPLRVLLETFSLDSFQGLSKTGAEPSAAGSVPGEIPVAGLVCASDPEATSGRFRAPVSYRACTGADIQGETGPFAPGRRLSLQQVEAGDGASYTAGFSERLVGDGRENSFGARNYATLPGAPPAEGCNLALIRAQDGRWHGDAGSSWRTADYRSTLYNHALPPGGGLSCASADGQTAFMGAASGHERGVNLLLLDGSVRLVRPSIAPPVWKQLSTVPRPDDGPPVP